MKEKISSQFINESAIWPQIRNTAFPLIKYRMKTVASVEK